MTYIVQDYLISPKKKDIEKILKKYKLCGPIFHINGIWAFRIVGDTTYYILCQDDCIGRTKAKELAFAIDEIEENKTIIICGDEFNRQHI